MPARESALAGKGKPSGSRAERSSNVEADTPTDSEPEVDASSIEVEDSQVSGDDNVIVEVAPPDVTVNVEVEVPQPDEEVNPVPDEGLPVNEPSVAELIAIAVGPLVDAVQSLNARLDTVTTEPVETESEVITEETTEPDDESLIEDLTEDEAPKSRREHWYFRTKRLGKS